MKWIKHHWKASLTVLAVLSAIGFVFEREMHPYLQPVKPSKDGDIVARYHVSMETGGPVIDVCGVKFLLDTGTSSVGHISPESLQKLESAGLVTKKEWGLGMHINALGGWETSTTQVRTSFPATGGQLQDVTSEGILDGVWFYVGGEENIIGLDMLEQFVLEWQPSKDSLYFRKNVPEGYSAMLPMKKESMIHRIGHLYFVELEVNGRTDKYMMDSGRRGIILQRPISDTIYSHTIIDGAGESESGSSRRLVEAYWGKDEIAIGGWNMPEPLWNHYAKSNFKYNVNPFALLNRIPERDFAFDFKNEVIYWRENESSSPRMPDTHRHLRHRQQEEGLL